tara:strand:- start:1349 stop:1576 length:228 start_codon:yes stop_codon:yes gene_type:complete
MRNYNLKKLEGNTHYLEDYLKLVKEENDGKIPVDEDDFDDMYDLIYDEAMTKFGEGSSKTENNINKLKRLLYVQN